MIGIVAFVIAFLTVSNLWLLLSRRRRVVVIHAAPEVQSAGR